MQLQLDPADTQVLLEDGMPHVTVFRAGAAYPIATALFVAPSSEAGNADQNEALAYDGGGDLAVKYQAGLEAGSVSSLLAGGDSLPTEQLPRPKMRKALSPLSLPPPLTYTLNFMAVQQSAPPLLPAPQHFLTGSQPAQLVAEWSQHRHLLLLSRSHSFSHMNSLLLSHSLPQFSRHLQLLRQARKGSPGSNKGSEGVSKTCQACSLIQNVPLKLTSAHQSSCIYCSKCAVKSKDRNHNLKMVDGVPHKCSYK